MKTESCYSKLYEELKQEFDEYSDSFDGQNTNKGCLESIHTRVLMARTEIVDGHLTNIPCFAKLSNLDLEIIGFPVNIIMNAGGAS